MFDLEAYIEPRRRLVDAGLERVLPPDNRPPAVLHRAMRHAVLGGGKRLRPIVCLAAADAALGRPPQSLPGDDHPAMFAALSLELLHAYTLVHDDLPAMDNDALRRGRPTCHVQFGEANAILAGDAMQALAFEVAARAHVPPPHHPHAAVIELARAAGSAGVAAGQVEDLAAVGTTPSAEQIAFIHRHKTAVLFGAAARMGALCAGAPPGLTETLGGYGLDLGLLFQITDDLLDADSAADRGEASCVTAMTAEQVARRADELTARCVAAARGAGPCAEPLAALAAWVRVRTA